MTAPSATMVEGDVSTSGSAVTITGKDESIDATLRLIDAIGAPRQTIRLARRIIGSAIGSMNQPMTTVGGGRERDFFYEGGRGTNDTSSSFAPAVVRRVSRSYSRYYRQRQKRRRRLIRMSLNDCNNDDEMWMGGKKEGHELENEEGEADADDDDERRQLPEDLDRIERLYQRLASVSTERRRQGGRQTVDVDMSTKVMIMLGYLMGTKDNVEEADVLSLPPPHVAGSGEGRKWLHRHRIRQRPHFSDSAGRKGEDATATPAHDGAATAHRLLDRQGDGCATRDFGPSHDVSSRSGSSLDPQSPAQPQPEHFPRMDDNPARGHWPNLIPHPKSETMANTNYGKEKRAHLYKEQERQGFLRAIRDEEVSLVRECVFALRGIDGSRLRFLLNSDHSYETYYQSSGGANGATFGHRLSRRNDRIPVEMEGIRVNPHIRTELFDVDVKLLALPAGHKCDDERQFLNNSSMTKRELSPAIIDAIKICGECGWLFLKLRQYIDLQQCATAIGFAAKTKVITHGNERVGGGQGIVARALAAALSDELMEYHRLVAVLESEAAVSSSTTRPKEDALTLRRLLVWIRPAMHRLRTLALVVDGVHPLIGGQLGGALHRHVLHISSGDSRHAEVIRRLATRAVTPLYEKMFLWVFYGLLHGGGGALSGGKSLQDGQGYHDDTDEFFIREDLKIPDARLWETGGRYDLQTDMIPCFISKSLAATILDVGKGVNFTRKCLKNSSWNLLHELLSRKNDLDEADTMKGDDDAIVDFGNQDFPPSSSSLHSLDRTSFLAIGSKLGFQYRREGRMESTIRLARSLTHSHMVMALLERYDLRTHLLALRKIMLLSQGDFLQALLDGLGPILSLSKDNGASTSVDGKGVRRRPLHSQSFGGGTLHSHTLFGAVDNALRSTNAKYLPESILGRVHVRMLEPVTPEESGWDTFSLDYAVDAPLTAVVHRGSQKKYRRVFHLLWRLKRVEWSLNRTWRKATVVNRALRGRFEREEEDEEEKETTNDLQNDGEGKETRPAKKTTTKTTRVWTSRRTTVTNVLRRAALTRQEISHFASNLQSYLMFEVLESSWKVLMQKMNQACTLDDLVDAHDQYINDIVAKSLLVTEDADNGLMEWDEHDDHDASHDLALQLSLVLDAACRFVKVQESMYTDAIEGIARDEKRNRQRDANEHQRTTRRTHCGRLGVKDTGEDHHFSDKDKDKDDRHCLLSVLTDESCLEAVQSTSEEFDVALREFLRMLNERVDTGGIRGNAARPTRDEGAAANSRGESITPPQTIQSTSTQGSLSSVGHRGSGGRRNGKGGSSSYQGDDDDALRFLTFRLDFNQFYDLAHRR